MTERSGSISLTCGSGSGFGSGTLVATALSKKKCNEIQKWAFGAVYHKAPTPSPFLEARGGQVAII
jgi:hypothetical protein